MVFGGGDRTHEDSVCQPGVEWSQFKVPSPEGRLYPLTSQMRRMRHRDCATCPKFHRVQKVQRRSLNPGCLGPNLPWRLATNPILLTSSPFTEAHILSLLIQQILF